jgi:RNA polymerase sigma factor (sigma-70 family)
MPWNHVSLVNDDGQPFSARLHDALLPLAPRLQRDFPALRDDYALTEVLEEAARRLVARERRGGAVRNLPAYAWVTARRTAARRLHHGAWAVVGATLSADDSAPVLASLPSAAVTLEHIEQEILAHELYAWLSPDERTLCLWKQAGLSTKEIARRHGLSLVAVRTRWHRLKRKLVSVVTTAARRPGEVRG